MPGSSSRAIAGNLKKGERGADGNQKQGLRKLTVAISDDSLAGSLFAEAVENSPSSVSSADGLMPTLQDHWK